MSSVHGLRRFKGTDKKCEKGLPVPFAVLDLKNLVFSQSAREEDTVEGKHQGTLEKNNGYIRGRRRRNSLSSLLDLVQLSSCRSSPTFILGILSLLSRSLSSLFLSSRREANG